MCWLQVESQFRAIFEALQFDSFEAIATHFTRGASLRGEVFVTRGTLSAAGRTIDVFFKLYRYERPSWRFWHRASKARREFENYLRLESLGVPVAERVACGEERDAIGRLKRAFIITLAVPEARTLIEFVETRPGREARSRVFAELAQATRAMHGANFFYHDLVWRNLLVDGTGQLRLIDCPRGAVAHFGRERKRLRDLASLDKSAWKFCRRSERLRFVLAYLGAECVDDDGRKLIRECVAYRRRRWPEDWGGK